VRIYTIHTRQTRSSLSTMATCLSPVNLAAPMSAFFLKPTGVAYAPFSRENFSTASVVTRQPRGPPAPNATTSRKIPAPVTVAPTAPTTSWRDRVSSGPAEMPTPPNTPKSSPTAKSGKRKGRRSGSQSPKPVAQSFIADVKSETSVAAPESNQLTASSSVPITIEDSMPASRVYGLTLLLGLSASPLVGVTPDELTHMEDLVWNHTWRRGPHQSVSPPSSRSSSRASSPAPSSRSASPAPVRRLRRGEHRRTNSKLRNTTSDDCGTCD